MRTETGPPERRMPARLLDLSPWPLAILEALALVSLLDQWLLFPLAVLLLHDRGLPARLRKGQLRDLAWPSSVRVTAGVMLTSVGSPESANLLVAVLGGHGVVLLGLHLLLRRGHFLPRVAVVGAPESTAPVAARLQASPVKACDVVGEFTETSADLARLLDIAREEGLDTVLLAGTAGTDPAAGNTLQRLREISAPVVRAVVPGESAAMNRGLVIDALSTREFLDVARDFGKHRFGFAVTPNAHHLVRLQQDAVFRASYAAADFVLLDSRFIAHWLRWTRGEHWKVCPGSDLTAALFKEILNPADRLVIVGGTSAQVEQLRLRHGLREVHHHRPPMGFIHDPVATAECLGFIERHSPFRFCLLAVGAPQQERIAADLKHRGRARGLALCVGASLDFLTGAARRAPRWMRVLGLEWLHRWWREPRRLTRRYLLECPQVFSALRRHPLRPRLRTLSRPTAPAAAPPDPAGSVPPATRRRTG